MSALRGKKTYIPALAGILGILNDATGAEVLTGPMLIDVVQEIIPYLVAIFLRHGWKK